MAPSELPPKKVEYSGGVWLAFRAVGRLVASCATLKELEASLQAGHENAEELLHDWIQDASAIRCGSELPEPASN
jgi:hypothetical protein